MPSALLRNKQDRSRLQLKLSVLLPRKLPPPQKPSALPPKRKPKERLASLLKKSSIMPITDLQDSLWTSSSMIMPTDDQPDSFHQRRSSPSSLTLLASIFQNTRTSSTDLLGSEELRIDLPGPRELRSRRLRLRRLNQPPKPMRIASTDQLASEEPILLPRNQEPHLQQRNSQALALTRDLKDSGLSLPRLPSPRAMMLHQMTQPADGRATSPNGESQGAPLTRPNQDRLTSQEPTSLSTLAVNSISVRMLSMSAST